MGCLCLCFWADGLFGDAAAVNGGPGRSRGLQQQQAEMQHPKIGCVCWRRLEEMVTGTGRFDGIDTGIDFECATRGVFYMRRHQWLL